MPDADRRRDHEPVRDGCCRAYRRIARLFLTRTLATADGLEQLGEDLVPRVWQQQGVVGLIGCLGISRYVCHANTSRHGQTD